MEEVVAEAGRPLFRLFYYIFRLILWLAWDLSVQIIGWSVGWFFLRIITIGNFPKYLVTEQERAPFGQALLVELVGLAIIGFITLVLYGLAFQ
ncbi:hypothetical protein J7384_16935 [Endozoicomonas sp. G2_1]|uniref:hypothetical protein n=1 Tax=Endozoicomonas sp. G2_1 TaxID=2821091 RepID=UPI001AD9F59B|nr:hypothetical protein [Endozoicomonas sp. G2_1]MBO9492049.1 hypothetical protein [Endozoicomonas sp. G2_1]